MSERETSEVDEDASVVTVCIITYNHQKYVCECIESVLGQKTDFVFKIVVADDCSTDGTVEHLLRYQNRYPEKFSLILQKTNIGPARNWFQLITTPKTEFIAYLEGDDYWLDPFKLQKQLDFLRRNKDVNLVFTKYNFDGKTLDALHFSSVLFRNDFELPAEILSVHNGDTFFYALMLMRGKRAQLDFVGHFRRRHANSNWSSRPQKERLTRKLESYKVIISYVERNCRTEAHQLLLDDLHISRGLATLRLFWIEPSLSLLSSVFFHLFVANHRRFRAVRSVAGALRAEITNRLMG